MSTSRSVLFLLALAGLTVAAQAHAQGRSPATPPPEPTPWPATGGTSTGTPAPSTGTIARDGGDDDSRRDPWRSFSLSRQAYRAPAAPAPLRRYPICKKGQYDKCMQRGGR